MEFMTVAEVARLLHFDPRTIRRMVDAGELDGGRYRGGRIRVARQSVADYIQRGRTTQPSPLTSGSTR